MSSVASAVFPGTSSSISSNWLADTMTAIQNSQTPGGILGALQNSGSNVFQRTANTANAFATIAQGSVTNATQLIAQIQAQRVSQENAKKVQDALDALQQTQQMVQPKNVADPVIYLGDGATLDTNSNILTESDGKQYDALTGAPYVDPASIVQLANGAYIDTKNNIMTMPDGSQIDIVTGLPLSVVEAATSSS